MIDVLVVSGEPLWPPVHGGRIRTARLADALAGSFRLRVLAPGPAPPGGPEHDPLPDEPRPGRRAAFLSLEPAVGRWMLGALRREAVAAAVRQRRPAAVLLAQSPLAALAPELDARLVVDFHDVEVDRMASLARRGAPRKRLAWGWEHLKARRWEPRLARRAALTVAAGSRDVARLSAWGAEVVWVPHGVDRRPVRPSPAAGPVTFVGGMGYGPNLDGARLLLDEIWPRVRARRPDIPLRIVGSQAERVLGSRGGRDNVEVVSDPVDIERFYAEAALVVAPVREGGGAQVKVSHALASGRVVVATPHSLLSAPAGAAGAVAAAGTPERFAELVVRLWCDVGERRSLESLLEAQVIRSWEEAARPLVARMERMLGGT